MKNILIIGCGLLGSSLLKRIQKKKLAKRIYIYEKSKSNIVKIKKRIADKKESIHHESKEEDKESNEPLLGEVKYKKRR